MRILYVVWITLPTTLFLCFLWSALEGYRTGKLATTIDLWNSTAHTTIVATCTIIIHHYGITPLLDDTPSKWQVRTLIDVATLPFCLIVAARLMGASPVTKPKRSRRYHS